MNEEKLSKRLTLEMEEPFRERIFVRVFNQSHSYEILLYSLTNVEFLGKPVKRQLVLLNDFIDTVNDEIVKKTYGVL